MCTAVVIGISALGSLLQGYSAQQAYKSQAAAMEANARIADMRATDSIKRGGREEGDIRRRAQMIAGTQNANAAASGLASTSGSVLEAANQSFVNEERDVANNAINHSKEAWGYNMQANDYRAQASAARAAGSNAMWGGIIGAGTSLLSLAVPSIGGVQGAGGMTAGSAAAAYGQGGAAGAAGAAGACGPAGCPAPAFSATQAGNMASYGMTFTPSYDLSGATAIGKTYNFTSMDTLAKQMAYSPGNGDYFDLFKRKR